MTTRDLQLQALSGGLRSSGVVAGPVLIGQLVDSNSDVIAATVTGKASRKWNPAAGVSRTTSVDLTVQVKLKKLFRIQVADPYTQKTCQELADAIDGTAAAWTSYELVWWPPTRAPLDLPGPEGQRATEKLYLRLLGGTADVHLPDWTNAANPRESAAWQEFRTGSLKHELRHVKVLSNFLNAHRAPYVFHAFSPIGGTFVGDLLQAQEDKKLEELRGQLRDLQAKEHAKYGSTVPFGCP